MKESFTVESKMYHFYEKIQKELVKTKPAEHASCRIHSIDRSVTSHLDHRQASWNLLPGTVPLTIKGVHPLEDPTKADKQNLFIY